MDAIKHYGTYALLLLVLVSTIMLFPRCSRVQVREGYDDLAGLSAYESHALDPTISPASLRRGDGICFMIGEDDDKSTLFGWVAAMPGDEVAVLDGKLRVNNAVVDKVDDVTLPVCPAVRIPDNHFYIVSTLHRYDSVANGVLPMTAFRGKLRLP